jgi:hypothetical protein
MKPLPIPPRLAPLARYARYAALALLLLVIVQAARLLARDPCVGVADNRDYWRVARPAGIEVEAQPRHRQGRFVICTYPKTEPRLGSLFSSAALVAWTARPLRWGLAVADGEIDLRQVGLLYGALSLALLAAALALGLPPLRALLFAWVLADPGFLLFFNSLYADPALLLGLLGVVCLLPLPPPPIAGRRARWAVSALLVLCALLAGASKMQYSVFPGLLLAACLAGLLLERRRPDRTGLVFLGLLAVAAMAAPANFFWGSGPRFLDANAYDAVYSGIAQVASDPDAALAELGIPAEYRARPAKSFFAERIGHDDPVLPSLRKLSRLRLAALYLRDPEARTETAARIARLLEKQDTHPRGTYTREESGSQPRGYETPWQFAAWRGRIFGGLAAYTLWIFLAALLGVLIWRAASRRWNAEDTLALFLVLWVISQSAIGVLGDGLATLEQHLLGARLGLDLLLVLVVVRMLGACFRAGFRLPGEARPVTAVGAEVLDARHSEVEQDDELPGLGRQVEGGEGEEGRGGEEEEGGEALHRKPADGSGPPPECLDARPGAAPNLQPRAKSL